ncbi:DegT/DnrJ/EryC1/StrS aminotransferase family protein [Candidatus Woesearchaeota archaeon]|nr:DegT/DnrJ/EryC1/StrS aminotransferase family protein [Candidatus Woesearchaeota archaeon]
MIPVFKPDLGKEELDEIRKVFASNWIGLGPKTREFEEAFAKYIGTKFAVGTNSATAALHLAVAAHGIDSGEVIVPAITFVSTAHAAVYCNAKPILCDVDKETLCMDTGDLQKKITKNTKAIIPVHLGGHPCDMDAINDIAEDRGLIVIEDAANATGALYKGKKIGSLADSACFSFHAVKNMTTGEGGMITTDDEALVKRLYRLRWVGINKDTWNRAYVSAKYSWYYEVTELGWKYHMNDIPAAIGIAQLKKVDRLNEARRKIVERYNSSFSGLGWLSVPYEAKSVKHAYWLYILRVNDHSDRDKLIKHLAGKGIATSVHFMPVHLQPFYRDFYSRNKIKVSVPVADVEWKKMVTLPLYPSMTDSEVKQVVDGVRSFRK